MLPNKIYSIWRKLCWARNVFKLIYDHILASFTRIYRWGWRVTEYLLDFFLSLLLSPFFFFNDNLYIVFNIKVFQRWWWKTYKEGLINLLNTKSCQRNYNLGCRITFYDWKCTKSFVLGDWVNKSLIYFRVHIALHACFSFENILFLPFTVLLLLIW